MAGTEFADAVAAIRTDSSIPEADKAGLISDLAKQGGAASTDAMAPAAPQPPLQSIKPAGLDTLPPPQQQAQPAAPQGQAGGSTRLPETMAELTQQFGQQPGTAAEDKFNPIMGVGNLWNAGASGIGGALNTIGQALQNPRPLIGGIVKNFETEAQNSDSGIFGPAGQNILGDIGNRIVNQNLGVAGGAAEASANLFNALTGLPKAIEHAYYGGSYSEPIAKGLANIQIPTGGLQQLNAQHPFSSGVGSFAPLIATDIITGGAATPEIMGAEAPVMGANLLNNTLRLPSTLGSKLPGYAGELGRAAGTGAEYGFYGTPGEIQDRVNAAAQNAALATALHAGGGVLGKLGQAADNAYKSVRDSQTPDKPIGLKGFNVPTVQPGEAQPIGKSVDFGVGQETKTPAETEQNPSAGHLLKLAKPLEGGATVNENAATGERWSSDFDEHGNLKPDAAAELRQKQADAERQAELKKANDTSEMLRRYEQMAGPKPSKDLAQKISDLKAKIATQSVIHPDEEVKKAYGDISDRYAGVEKKEPVVQTPKSSGQPILKGEAEKTAPADAGFSQDEINKAYDDMKAARDKFKELGFKGPRDAKTYYNNAADMKSVADSGVNRKDMAALKAAIETHGQATAQLAKVTGKAGEVKPESQPANVPPSTIKPEVNEGLDAIYGEHGRREYEPEPLHLTGKATKTEAAPAAAPKSGPTARNEHTLDVQPYKPFNTTPFWAVKNDPHLMELRGQLPPEAQAHFDEMVNAGASKKKVLGEYYDTSTNDTSTAGGKLVKEAPYTKEIYSPSGGVGIKQRYEYNGEPVEMAGKRKNGVAIRHADGRLETVNPDDVKAGKPTAGDIYIEGYNQHGDLSTRKFTTPEGGVSFKNLKTINEPSYQGLTRHFTEPGPEGPGEWKFHPAERVVENIKNRYIHIHQEGRAPTVSDHLAAVHDLKEMIGEMKPELQNQDTVNRILKELPPEMKEYVTDASRGGC